MNDKHIDIFLDLYILFTIALFIVATFQASQNIENQETQTQESK